MKRFVAALSVASLTLVGCGGSLCEDVADSFQTLASKMESCSAFDGLEFEKPTDAEIEACEEAFDKTCSDADKKNIEKFIECIDDLKKCEAGSMDTFAISFLACATHIENVSEDCGVSAASTSIHQAQRLLSSQPR